MPTPETDHARWFSEEVLPHEGSLRRYLRGLLPTFPDIDDLVQESYTRMIRAKNAGKISYVKAFLFATARNAALDFLRRRKIISIDAVGDMAELCVLEDGLNSADALNRQQELALLADAVRALPERCRQVLTLRMFYGLSHKEIAANLGISDHTVKAQLAKGMRRCAEYFEQRGVLSPRASTPDSQ